MTRKTHVMLFPVLAAAALAGAPLAAAAGAQKQTETRIGSQLAQAKKKPAAKAGPRRLYAGRHGAWVLQCFHNPKKRVFCNLGQVHVYRLPAKEMKALRAAKFTGPPRVILLVHATTRSEVVTFISPTGWSKDSRIIARVDKGFGFGIDAPDKRALAPIAPKESLNIIEAMKKGNKLRIRFLPAIGDVQQAAFDLRGFTAGVTRMRALVHRYGKGEPGAKRGKGAKKLGPRATKPKAGANKK
jgi:invasion protein IalB